MNRFESPEALWLLALIPVLLIARWWMRRRLHPAVPFSSLSHARELTGGVRRFFRWLPGLVRALALASLVVALARPQFGQGQVKTTTRGVAMMIVVDRSASMDEPYTLAGQQTSKIEVTRDVVARFVEGDGDKLKGRKGDMIGLVTFAKFADTVCPLVRIHSTLVQLVKRVQLVGATIAKPEAGTAIGEGLALAAARLRDVEREMTQRAKAAAAEKGLAPSPSAATGNAQGQPGTTEPGTDDFSIKSKVIVLLTDGVENMGEVSALQAAELCKQWGIKVYAIGIGAGGIGGRGGPQRLANGMFIMRQGNGFDDTALKQVAKTTGGRYFPANDPASLERVSQEIDELEKTEIKTEEFTNYDERFITFAAAGAALLAFEAFLSAFILRRGP
jgi:Ca-activated chloride channel family protein